MSDVMTLLKRLDKTSRHKLIERLSPDDVRAFLYDWNVWAREKQLPPGGDWNIWLLLAGRGFG